MDNPQKVPEFILAKHWRHAPVMITNHLASSERNRLAYWLAFGMSLLLKHGNWRDLKNFGIFFRRSFEAQIAMLPNMVDAFIFASIDKYKDGAYGWKLSGAGGGGYIIFVAEQPIPGAFQIKIRRRIL